MSGLLHTVQSFLDDTCVLSPGARVVVGVSGGVDSMVCAHVLRRLGHYVIAVHVNYGLRPESDEEAAFVRRWCASQAPPIPHRETHADPEEESDAGASLQAAARRQRYAYFAEVARIDKADAVATGHHQNDQAETILLNLLRGSGPEGLAGMRPSRPLESDGEGVPLIRPLLDVSRGAIEAYARRYNVPWRVDPTNATPKYRRNAIRHEVLPQLAELEPHAVSNLARAARLMRNYVDETMRPATDEHLDRCFRNRPAGGSLHLVSLRDLAPVWQRRVILAALARTLPEAPRSEAVAHEIARLIPAQVGRRAEFGDGTVWRGRTQLRFLPDSAVPSPVPVTPVPRNTDVALPLGTLRIEETDTVPDQLDAGGPTAAYVDAEQLGEPLTVRTWEDGDRFQPLGLGGSKTVSDFLTDAHVPPWIRRHVYVLCAGDAIVWVVGYRLDDRVRVRSSTNQVVRLQFVPSENPVFRSHFS